MSFVRHQLRDGEGVVHETHLHWITFLAPGFFTLVSLWFFASYLGELGNATGLPLLVGLVWLLVALIRHRTSEFAVTNRRVLIKTGLISRKSMETNLTKVEGINVDQDIPGRLLGYGTIVVRGTGGGSEPFRTIARPMVFRRVVQEQIELAVVAEVHDEESGTGGRRPQRACPWCAEMILAEARVCRYCQRDVDPAPAPPA